MSDGTTRDANVRLSADVDPYRRSVQQATQDTSKLTVAVDTLSQKLDGLAKRAGKKLLLFGAGGAAGIATVTTEAAQFEKQLSTLNATAAITGKSMGQVRTQVNQLTKDFPVSRGQAVELLTALDKLGVEGPKKLREVADSMVKLSASTGEDLGGLTSGLVELGKQMGTLQAGDMSNFANSLLLVSKNAGVSAQGVLQFSQAIAPTARVAGLTETQVLGVSAAFQKAGADGFAAANSFTSMLSDITRQVATGSPEIAKYANLIGVTSEQFRRMDRAEAVTQIFETINKQGPDAIKTLDRLGFDGVRTMRSIQAVASSGGLRKSIEDAVGAGTNNQALDKGSAAAMGGMADQLEKIGSQFQTLAVTVGTPFVQAFTPVVVIFEKILNVVNALVAPLAQVGALLSGALTGGALLVGGALTLSKLNSVLAAGSFVGRSSPVRGFRAGRQDAGEEGPGRSGQFTRWWQQPFYAAGRASAEAREAREGRPGMFNRAAALGVRAPFALATSLVNAQGDWYQDARRPGEQRRAPVLGGIGNLANAVAHPVEFTRGFRAGGGVAGAAGAARSPEEFGQALRGGVKEVVENTVATKANVSAQRQLAISSGALTKAFIRLEAQSLATGVATAGRGLAAGAKGLGGALVGLAGGPLALGGMAAIGAGTMAYGAWQDSKKAIEPGDAAAIDKYNAALGIGTEQLSSFAMAVKAATAALPKPTAMGDVRRISEGVVGLARTPNRELIDPQMANFRTTRQRAAYLRSLNITDPRQMQLVEADLVQSSNTQQAQAAVNMYYRQRNQPTNYTPIVQQAGASVYGTPGSMTWFRAGLGNPSDRTKGIIGGAYDNIERQQVVDVRERGQAFANQRAQNQALRFIAAATSGAQLGTKGGQQVATQAVRTYENRFLGGARSGFDTVNFRAATAGMSTRERAAYFSQMLAENGNKQVASRYQDMGLQGLGIQSLTGTALAQPAANSLYGRVSAIGQVGRMAINNQVVQGAVQHPGDVNAQYQGIQELYKNAKMIGTTFSGTDAELQKLKATIKDTNDPLYQLAQSAQQYNTVQRQNAQTYMGRQGRLGDSVANLRSIQGESPDAPDHMERLQGSQQELEENKKNYYAYLQSLVQAQKNYDIQMKRGNEDRNRTIMRSNRDFHLQMKRMTEDAAKALYDPWKRVYSTYTVDAGAMLQNLADQNERMQKQVDQVNQLRRRGLSKSAVDTLNLTDPSQQQQLDRLVTDIANDPGIINRINKQIGTRGEATKAMVQNTNSSTYRRAVEDHKRGLKDMTKDWEIQVTRTQEDLARMGDEVIGSFGSVMNRAIKMLKRNLGPLGDDIISELDKIKSKYPEMFGDSPAAASPAGAVGTYSPTSARAAEHAGMVSRQTPTNVHQADLASRTINNYQTNRTVPSSVNRGSGHTTVQHNTNFTGHVTVVAQDPNMMAKQLAAKARLHHLTKPALAGNS